MSITLSRGTSVRHYLLRGLPAAIVVMAMLALQVGWDANLGSALLYLTYELGFVVIPGWLLYRVLVSDPGGPIRQVALGWALGLTLEVLAFILTAALDVRTVFSVYPLIVGIPCALILLRRRGSAPAQVDLSATDADARRTLRFGWALAGVCVTAVGLLAVVYFPSAPAPGSGETLYFRDYGWHLALAAEAKNHWPILDPNVSGEPLPYHYFVHIHMAAASQVTSIDLPLIFFRLFNLPLIVLAVLLYVTAGLSFVRSAWVGLVAAGLALFVGDLQLETSSDLVPHAPFLGVFVAFLVTSPSFLFGLPIFLALLVVIGERLTATNRSSIGDWALVALLVIGATNAKVTILPLVLLALGVFGGWVLLRERRISREVLLCGAIVAFAGGITYLTQYAGHSSGLALNLGETFNQMPAVISIKSYVAGLIDVPAEGVLLGVGGMVLGLLGLLGAQLVGFQWGGVARLIRRRPVIVWLLGLFAGGVLVMLLLHSPGTGNQVYFILYGVAAGWLVAAIGFQNIWRRRPDVGDSAGRVALLSAAWLALLIFVMRAPFAFDLFSGTDALAQTFVFWYAGLAATLVFLLVAARRWLTPAGWWTGAMIGGAFVLIGAIGTVSNYVAPELTRPTPVTQEADPSRPTSKGLAALEASTLTPAGFAALEWIRDNTPTDSRIAVNHVEPFNFKYAAFAERETFLQGWAYARKSFDTGYENVLAGSVDGLFPGRAALNEAAFAGDPVALQTLADQYGVEYLIVEGTGGAAVDVDETRLSRLTRPVFEAPGIRVLELNAE